MKHYFYTIFIIIIALNSCNTESKEKHLDDHHEHDHSPSNELSLTTEQIQLLNLSTGKAQPRYISKSISINGTLELPPQNKASLSSIANGRVKSISVLEGEYVKKGQIIAHLENPSFIELQKNYLSAISRNRLLKTNYNRKKALLEDSIISQREFELVAQELQNNEIEIKANETQLQLLELSPEEVKKNISTTIPVRSPINGYVRVIKTNIYSYINSGETMFEIVDNDHLHIDLMVFEKDIPFIKEKQKVSFYIPSNKNKIYNAEIFAIGKALEENKNAVRVHAEMHEDYPELLPGMFIKANVYSDTTQQLTLPNDAFIQEDNVNYVFIVENSNDDKTIFKKQRVKTGISDENNTVILPSSSFDINTTTFVTRGAFFLNADLNKESFEHEH